MNNTPTPMDTTHSVTGELISADLDVQHGFTTITLLLRQCNRGYSNQRITAMRSYPHTLAAGREARDHHAALRCGSLYRLQADGISISQASGMVYLLGVRDVQPVPLYQHPYPLAHGQALQTPPAAELHEPHEPNSLAAEGACRGLAMSLPRALRTAGDAP